MTEMNIEYNPGHWRIFTEIFKELIKDVLLYYDNFQIPNSFVYGINVKETYDSIRFILDAVKYEEHECRVSCDLKVVSFLSDM